VAVAAGVVRVVEGGTVLPAAGVEAATEQGCSAGDDVGHRPPVGTGHAVAESLLDDRLVSAENLRHLGQESGSGPLHESIDGLDGSVSDLPSDVGVDSGGLRTGVAEEGLDELEGESVLEQMGGVGVAQGVDTGPLVDGAGGECPSKGSLDGVVGDGPGIDGDGVLDAVPGDGWKEPTG
jgi:hypothetical protein